jgi:hypothetical protein
MYANQNGITSAVNYPYTSSINYSAGVDVNIFLQTKQNKLNFNFLIYLIRAHVIHQSQLLHPHTDQNHSIFIMVVCVGRV